MLIHDEAQHDSATEKLLTAHVLHSEGISISLFDVQQTPPFMQNPDRDTEMERLLNSVRGGT